MTTRRHTLQLLAATALPASFAAKAHHGWSSFDLDRPIYLEGKAAQVKWQNPHTEMKLEVAAGLKLPADLSTRSIPAQTANVDAPALLKKASLPKRTDKTWEIELAPLTRMEAFKDEKGSAILRAEFLWLDGKTYALRSSPV
jgi:hypothetical protein